MKKKDVQADRPCAGCPWLRVNQTPAAVAASPVDGRGVHWFEKENLLKHWKASADVGAMLPCHMTDEKAPLYGGKFTKSQDARICVGLATLARREVTAFLAAGQNFDRYSELPGRRWSAVGLAAWAARLYYAGSVFVLGSRKFTMPKIEGDDARLGVPWKDSVHCEGR